MAETKPTPGQPPQYGFTNNYQPSPQAHALGQVLQALQDPRNQWMGMGMLGPAGRFSKFFGKTPPDIGGFNVPTKKMIYDAPIKEAFQESGVPNPTNQQMRQNYLDAIEGMHMHNQMQHTDPNPAIRQAATNSFNAASPALKQKLTQVQEGMHDLRSDVLNRRSQFFTNQDYPTDKGDLRKPTYPEHN